MVANQGKEFEIARETAWCPGCGNFGILNALSQALEGLGLKKSEVLYVSGIGQAGKTPHYIHGNVLNTLHGRTLPTATGAKLANNDLHVIAIGGDGDGYAEEVITSCMPFARMSISPIWSMIIRSLV